MAGVLAGSTTDGDMGGHPYWYFVKYEDDIQAALDKLRESEFAAGRYNPAVPFPEFPITAASKSPGAKHASIEDALEAAAEDGTRSILDISTVAEDPDFCCASPLDDDIVNELYATAMPTRAQVEENMDFLDEIDRGQCVYLVLYKNGAPDEILFAGYSFD